MDKYVVYVHAWGMPYYVGRNKEGKYAIGSQYKLRRISHFSSQGSALRGLKIALNNGGGGATASVIPAEKWDCTHTMKNAPAIHVIKKSA